MLFFVVFFVDAQAAWDGGTRYRLAAVELESQLTRAELEKQRCFTHAHNIACTLVCVLLNQFIFLSIFVVALNYHTLDRKSILFIKSSLSDFGSVLLAWMCTESKPQGSITYFYSKFQTVTSNKG